MNSLSNKSNKTIKPSSSLSIANKCLGDSGMNNVPIAKINPITDWIDKGNLHDNEDGMNDVK